MDVRRRQEDRRAATRRALVAAARTLFAQKGYAATSTPEIVKAAGVTRGALYHHFADKQALFAAVVEEEHAVLALTIHQAAEGGEDEPGPVKALIRGGDGFLAAMQDEGRRRMLIVDAPAVLGRATVDEIDGRHGLRTLVEGVDAAIEAGAIKELPSLPLAHLLSAMFDRAALVPADEINEYRKVMKALIRGLKK
ncbi:TetR/AcrR family transcriptional regulator [Devosia marina]|uniref:TetR family transcriptional regulator n=1 Tax=Devosia marina TaxID=2683198 RepID=A0A7X3FUG4_9HYPH|nr:TetR/AcrR family transcriptional regulator [Devosia marina]MVT00886.1 TetR family transcriptional regulator [Devosia marina]